MVDRRTASESAHKFDRYAKDYGDLVGESVASSGETPEYFTQHKMSCLGERGLLRAPILDYGCGVGTLTTALVERAAEVHAFDPSAASLSAVAERAPRATLHASVEAIPSGYFEVAILSCVLHHIVPEERQETLRIVREKLKRGGRIVVFEHNPLNPLTRNAVRLCPFDDDAVLLYPWQLRRTLREAGFVDVRLDYVVFFPRLLRALRPLERHLTWLALGAQTFTVAKN